MHDKNNVTVIPYCKCGKLKVNENWILPTPEAKAAIQVQRQRGYIKFVKSVCDDCVVKK